MLQKMVEWLRRYGPAEIVAIIGALAGGLLIHFYFNNPILTALGATWGENLGYYGWIILGDIRERVQRDGRITALGFAKVMRNFVLEFGPGEYLDSFVIRPIAMYIFPVLTGNVALGLFIGKISADVIFYIPTIVSYEFRKKYLKD